MAADRHLVKPLRLFAAGAFYCAAVLVLSGCAVVTVGAAAVSVTATAVGLAADAAVGTAKVVGKGVGKAYDMATGEEQDNSGITVRYREPTPGQSYPPQQQPPAHQPPPAMAAPAAATPVPSGP